MNYRNLTLCSVMAAMLAIPGHEGPVKQKYIGVSGIELRIQPGIILGVNPTTVGESSAVTIEFIEGTNPTIRLSDKRDNHYLIHRGNLKQYGRNLFWFHGVSNGFAVVTYAPLLKR